MVVLINYGSSFGCGAIDGCSQSGLGKTGIIELLSGVRVSAYL
jgi:hypothetical protein